MQYKKVFIKVLLYLSILWFVGTTRKSFTGEVPYTFLHVYRLWKSIKEISSFKSYKKGQSRGK